MNYWESLLIRERLLAHTQRNKFKHTLPHNTEHTYTFNEHEHINEAIIINTRIHVVNMVTLKEHKWRYMALPENTHIDGANAVAIMFRYAAYVVCSK